jgi:two-component system phosphate regulon response regulator PhoB
MFKPSILLVEDDQALSVMLSFNLEKSGFKVRSAADGEEAISLVGEEIPDLMILDWMIPKLSGLEVCRIMRRKKESSLVPIIMLTARSEVDDRLRGLEVGADDYITKPFSPKELIARIKAVLRRSKPMSGLEELSSGGLVMNLSTHKVKREGQEIHLGPIEYKLLRHFMENPGRVFSRGQLIDSVWGPSIYIEMRTVDVHIRRLRKAIHSKHSKDLIKTIRSAGYAFDPSTF